MTTLYDSSIKINNIQISKKDKWAAQTPLNIDCTMYAGKVSDHIIQNGGETMMYY